MTPRLDKRTRFEAQTSVAGGRRLSAAGASAMARGVSAGASRVPAGRYDDQVDAFIQFVDWSRSPRVSAFLDRDPVSGRRSGLRRH